MQPVKRFPARLMYSDGRLVAANKALTASAVTTFGRPLALIPRIIFVLHPSLYYFIPSFAGMYLESSFLDGIVDVFDSSG